MLVTLVAIALLAGVIWALPARQRRTALVVGGAALCLRAVVAVLIHVLAEDSNGNGVWLNDEASFYLATGFLLPQPWNQALPEGLDHLAGSGYLGLTALIGLGVGNDALAYRMFNVGLGSVVAVLSSAIATELYGRRAGLIAGLAVAAWPTLVLWSATMLRDTACSFAVVVVWWTLLMSGRRSSVSTVCTCALAVVFVASMRPYLAVAMAVGMAAFVLYPFVRRQRPRTLVLGAVVALLAVVGVAVQQARRVDYLSHELLYRQTVTRMETLGRLYRDRPLDAPVPDPPFRINTAVAIADPSTGWLLTGLVQEPAGEGHVTVAFVDDSVRTLPTSELLLLDGAPIPPQQLVSWIPGSVFSLITGLGQPPEPTNPVWVLDALAWTALAGLAAYGTQRARLSSDVWAFPLCVVLGTVLTLIAVPGAPGNANRHRTSQTLPFVVVLTSGLLSSWLAVNAPVRVSRRPTRMPASEVTPAISRSRSPR